MDRRQFLTTTAGAMAAGALRSGLQAEGPQDPPLNVLFIMTDQQYGRCVGYANHPCVQTPHLDALARDGVVFDNAYCAYPVCTASRCSILTGTWPHTHGCNLNVGSPEANPEKGLPPQTVMTESIFHDRGYVTKHRGKWHAGDQQRHACYQAEDGYRHMHPKWRAWLREALPPENFRGPAGQTKLYDYPLYMTPEVTRMRETFTENDWIAPGQDITLIGRTAIPFEYLEETWVTNETLELLDRYGDQPFMMTCSLHPPHAFWTAPDPYYSMYDPRDIELPSNQARPDYYKNSTGVRLFDTLGPGGVKEFLRCYYAQVTVVDDLVGRLVKKLKDLGQYENTLIVFTSDHGDMNGAHQMVSKAVTPAMYEETTRVPLLMSCPGLLPRGRRVQTAANGVDLMPTILDYAGLPTPDQVQGESLRRYIDGAEDLDRPAFTEGTHPNAQHVGRRIRTHEWRFYFSYQNWSTKKERFEYNTPPELFNLLEDPGEEDNLAADPKCADNARRLDGQLRQHLSDTKDPWLPQLPPLEL